MDYHANLNAQTNKSSTALILASRRLHVDVVRILLVSGCELYVEDERGRTAFQIFGAANSTWGPDAGQGTSLPLLLDNAVQVQLMREHMFPSCFCTWID